MQKIRFTFSLMLLGAVLFIAGVFVGGLVLMRGQQVTVAGSIDTNQATSSVLTVSSPQKLQYFQRDISTNVGIVLVRGTYSNRLTSPSIIVKLEAENFSTGWQNATVAGNAFQYDFPNVPSGQYTFTAKVNNVANSSVSIEYVSVGDIYVVAGQSNASGRGTELVEPNYQNKFINGLFGNDDKWRQLKDPTDSAKNQVDPVSSDGIAAGSVWPVVARRLQNATNIPIAIVPTARAGSSIADWQPDYDASVDGYSMNLFQSMLRRAHAVGKVRAILWWQGEEDARKGMTQGTYELLLKRIAISVDEQLHVPMMVAQIGRVSNAEPINVARIRLAQADSWVFTKTGPVLNDIILDDHGGDGVHFKEDGDIRAAAQRWSEAMKAAFYK